MYILFNLWIREYLYQTTPLCSSGSSCGGQGGGGYDNGGKGGGRDDEEERRLRQAIEEHRRQLEELARQVRTCQISVQGDYVGFNTGNRENLSYSQAAGLLCFAWL